MKKKVTPEQLLGEKKGVSAQAVASMVKGGDKKKDNPIYEEMRKKQAELDKKSDILDEYSPSEDVFIWRPPEG